MADHSTDRDGGASRLRGMASDPRNVGDMKLLLRAAEAVERTPRMEALLRELHERHPKVACSHTDLDCNHCACERIAALLAELDAAARLPGGGT